VIAAFSEKGDNASLPAGRSRSSSGAWSLEPSAPSHREESPLLLEVIVQTVADARAAAQGGADRLEVIRNIHDGGLTPPLPLVRAIQDVTALPLRVMVRENAGFSTTAGEWPALRRAAAELATMGVDGLVVGFARDGEPALDDVARVLEAAPGLNVTFHRAFDQLRAPLEAIDTIRTVAQIDRILTSGGDGTPLERSARLRALSQRAAGRLLIIAGGGVDEEALSIFAAEGCVSEAHVGRAAREGGDPDGAVSASRVRRLREIAEAGTSSRPT
jgi:copper homeostasis protein